MSANEQKIGHFSIDLQRTTKTTEHTLTAKLQSTIVHVTKTLVIIFGHWNRKKQKQKQAFSCKQADPPLRVCFKSSNLVPRVFSLSNMAAAGEKTLVHSELKRSLIGAFHGAFIRALSLVCSFQKQRFWLFDGLEVLSSEFGTKKVDGIQVWLFGKLWLYRLKANSKKVHRFNSYFHRCSACVLRYPRSSFSQTSCFIHLQMPTISYKL